MEFQLKDILIILSFIYIMYCVYKSFKEDSTLPLQCNCKKVLKVVNSPEDIKKLIKESVKDSVLKENLEKLMKLDKSFDMQSFIDYCTQTFEKVFKAFNSKDLSSIKNDISSDVMMEFEKSINDLNKNKHTIFAEIVRFKKIIVKSINIIKKDVYIVVEFETEQTAVLKDDNGKVLKGDANQIETINDIWGFTKSFSRKNSSWILGETMEV